MSTWLRLCSLIIATAALFSLLVHYCECPIPAWQLEALNAFRALLYHVPIFMKDVINRILQVYPEYYRNLVPSVNNDIILLYLALGADLGIERYIEERDFRKKSESESRYPMTTLLHKLLDAKNNVQKTNTTKTYNIFNDAMDFFGVTLASVIFWPLDAIISLTTVAISKLFKTDVLIEDYKYFEPNSHIIILKELSRSMSLSFIILIFNILYIAFNQ